MLVAAQNNNIKAVQTLLKAGADVNAQSKDDCTALMAAAKNRHTNMLQTLTAGPIFKVQFKK